MVFIVYIHVHSVNLLVYHAQEIGQESFCKCMPFQVMWCCVEFITQSSSLCIVYKSRQWRMQDFFSKEVLLQLDAGSDAAPALKKSLSGGGTSGGFFSSSKKKIWVNFPGHWVGVSSYDRPLWQAKRGGKTEPKGVFEPPLTPTLRTCMCLDLGLHRLNLFYKKETKYLKLFSICGCEIEVGTFMYVLPKMKLHVNLSSSSH